ALVACNQGPAMRDQRIATDVSARLEYYYRLDRFTPAFVGDADDRRIRHVRMGHESLFHLAAVDVLAATDDHVLFPVGEIDKPILVGIAHVAGVKPAIS